MRVNRILGGIASFVLVVGCGTGSSPTGSSALAPSGTPGVRPTASTVARTTAPAADISVGDGEEWIAYQWMAGSGDGIYLIRPDGTGRHQLAADAGASQEQPDWSPDGKQIAFIAVTPADRHELWLVNAGGDGAKKLLSCDLPCNTVTFPDWASDGSAIYFAMDANATSGPPRTFEVGRYDVATGKVTVVLKREDGMTAEQPRISPDAKNLAYLRYRDVEDDAAGSAIFVTDLKGGPEHRLTEWTLFGAYPDWSVTGRIVFNSRDLGAFQDTSEPANLYSVRPDGTDLRQLTRFGPSATRATQPRWTPDGSGIVFTQVEGAGFGTRHLAFIAADGSGQGLLTPTPEPGTHPELRPQGG
jgi:Tol biopolymer transport system component